jgi:hypothetical protein
MLNSDLHLNNFNTLATNLRTLMIAPSSVGDGGRQRERQSMPLSQGNGRQFPRGGTMAPHECTQVSAFPDFWQDWLEGEELHLGYKKVMPNFGSAGLANHVTKPDHGCLVPSQKCRIPQSEGG